jgi:hypothetical protein
MTRAILLFSAVAVFGSFSAPEAEAAKLTKRVLRGFYGIYEGPVSGFYGVDSGGGVINPQPTSYQLRVKVNGRRNTTAFSGTGRAHNLKFSKATGNRRRIRIRGVYSGTFQHPGTAAVEQATGVRRYSIKKRGSGKNATYKMRARDELREGTLSYSNVTGNLTK